MEPSLTQRRESADVVALAELIDSNDTGRTYRLHKVTKGAARLKNQEQLRLPADETAKPGELTLLLGEESAEGESATSLAWTAIRLSESSVAYVFRAPDLRQPADERLRYFAPFLEHADPLIAEDAYREFGHAPYDVVDQVADALHQNQIRAWLKSAGIPQSRKGFYGLALGLARDDDEKAKNASFLRKLIDEPQSDFRAGFDGLLGGYLLVAGEPALDLIEERFLANPEAAHGDVRHALTALRFYYEFGHEITRSRLIAALRKLLPRPEFSSLVIADLSRWEDWESLDAVVALFDAPAYADRGTRRAVAAFVLSCPQPRAAAPLTRLRASAPGVVAEAEELLSGSVTGQ